MTLELHDLGDPSLSAATNEILVFTIVRNANPPIFFGTGNYYREVNEDEPSGYNVITVSATDADTQVSQETYCCLGP